MAMPRKIIWDDLGEGGRGGSERGGEREGGGVVIQNNMRGVGTQTLNKEVSDIHCSCMHQN